MSERVTVKVLLLFGDQAEIVGDDDRLSGWQLA